MEDRRGLSGGGDEQRTRETYHPGVVVDPREGVHGGPRGLSCPAEVSPSMEEESTRTTSWVQDALPWLGVDHSHAGLDHVARGEELPPLGLGRRPREGLEQGVEDG